MSKNYKLYAVAALFFVLRANAYTDAFDVIRPDKGRELPVSEHSPEGFGFVEVENKGGGTRFEYKPIGSPFDSNERRDQRYDPNEHKDSRYYDQD